MGALANEAQADTYDVEIGVLAEEVDRGSKDDLEDENAGVSLFEPKFVDSKAREEC